MTLLKVHVIIIYDVDIFTKYETLFETVLPITYQFKTKMPRKNRKCVVYL